MKVAIVQFKAIKGEINKCIAKHINWIKKAAIFNADLIMFPELSLTGYEPDLANKLATTKEDTRLDKIQEYSNKYNMVVCAGLPTRSRNLLYISMIVFQPAEERISYSKQFLHHTEVPPFTSGKIPLVIRLESDIIAPAICFELSQKKHHDFAISNKANIYMASVMNSVNGVESDLKKLGSIAKENRMITMMSNFVGKSGGYECGGKSSVWDRNGKLLAQLDNCNEGMIITDTLNEEIKIEI